MSKVVVISGHPNLAQSNTNTIILNELKSELSDVEVRRLDTLYPDYQINIEAEQQALLDADVIVLQFPFYWYSVPALLKKWIDDVLAYDFAFGAKGDKLKGKDFFLSFTVGGPEESYDPLGYNHFSIEQLVRPLQQTAYLTGMNYHEPVYTHGMVYIPGVYNKLEDVQNLAKNHAKTLIGAIESVLYSAENKIRKFVAEWFGKFDQLPEDSSYFITHLDRAVYWQMPEGKFIGHHGFKEWYEVAKKTFKPGCDHQVEQIVVTDHKQGYQAELRIRLLAETFPDSPFNGESINMLVNEYWQLRFDEAGDPVIYDYLVEPVAN